jgi:hypothetical protein
MWLPAMMFIGSTAMRHVLPTGIVCVLSAAEDAVREMLCEFASAQGLPEVGTVTAEDQLDDGSIIRLAITIDRWGWHCTAKIGDMYCRSQYRFARQWRLRCHQPNFTHMHIGHWCKPFSLLQSVKECQRVCVPALPPQL